MYGSTVRAGAPPLASDRMLVERSYTRRVVAWVPYLNTLPHIRYYLMWHERAQRSAEHRWLRELIRDTARRQLQRPANSYAAVETPSAQSVRGNPFDCLSRSEPAPGQAASLPQAVRSRSRHTPGYHRVRRICHASVPDRA